MPSIDLPLGLAFILALLALLVLGALTRPEMSNGKLLDRPLAYACGMGTFLVVALALEIARGSLCACWATPTGQIVLDLVVVAGGCTAAWALLYLIKGPAREGNPAVELHHITKEVDKIYRAAISEQDHQLG